MDAITDDYHGRLSRTIAKEVPGTKARMITREWRQRERMIAKNLPEDAGESCEFATAVMRRGVLFFSLRFYFFFIYSNFYRSPLLKKFGLAPKCAAAFPALTRRV